MTNELEYELRDALRAQMDATTRLMLDAKFTAQEIMDCTAQAQRVLAMPSQDVHLGSILVEALRECAKDDFAGSNGISVYAAASNELVRRANIAKDALASCAAPVPRS